MALLGIYGRGLGCTYARSTSVKHAFVAQALFCLRAVRLTGANAHSWAFELAPTFCTVMPLAYGKREE